MIFFNDIAPQTSVRPRVRDGTSIGSKLIVESKKSVSFLCDAQSNPPPIVGLDLETS